MRLSVHAMVNGIGKCLGMKLSCRVVMCFDVFRRVVVDERDEQNSFPEPRLLCEVHYPIHYWSCRDRNLASELGPG